MSVSSLYGKNMLIAQQESDYSVIQYRKTPQPWLLRGSEYGKANLIYRTMT